jgi:hypothetical protein
MPGLLECEITSVARLVNDQAQRRFDLTFDGQAMRQIRARAYEGYAGVLEPRHVGHGGNGCSGAKITKSVWNLSAREESF